MKANELIREKGVDKAKSHLQSYGWRKTPFIIKLKLLVESHDYIESLGGYQFVKDNLPFGYFGDGDYKDLIQKCLEDVESCK